MRARVVFPAPEGEDRTSIRPLLCTSRPFLLDILGLLAELIDRGLESESHARQLDIGGFRAQRVRLAIELLREEVELAPDGVGGLQQGPRLADVGVRAIQLFAYLGA